MANIRIKDLSTTASSTASDDFFGVDGATNGTRKLSAYSPTFGGNLTVSGTSGISSTGPATFTSPTNIGSASTVWLGGNGSSGLFLNVPTGANMQFGINNSGKLSITGTAVSITDNLTVNGTGTSSIAGNLTVSGGTVTSGTGTLTLNSSANTVVLQSAGTTALTLNSSQNATFAGDITQSHSGNSVLSVSSTSGTGNQAIISLANTAQAWTLRNTGDNFGIRNDTLGSYFLLGDKTTNDATFAGTIATQGGTASTPASASATGTAGTIKWDASYIYVCTAANTWKRVAIATW
jgi:hypothetical protein